MLTRLVLSVKMAGYWPSSCISLLNMRLNYLHSMSLTNQSNRLTTKFNLTNHDFCVHLVYVKNKENNGMPSRLSTLPPICWGFLVQSNPYYAATLRKMESGRLTEVCCLTGVYRLIEVRKWTVTRVRIRGWLLKRWSPMEVRLPTMIRPVLLAWLY